MLLFSPEAQELQKFGPTVGVAREPGSSAGIDSLGETDVLFHAQRRKQIEFLEHESDFSPSQVGPLGVRHGGQVLLGNEDLPQSLKVAFGNKAPGQYRYTSLADSISAAGHMAVWGMGV